MRKRCCFFLKSITFLLFCFLFSVPFVFAQNETESNTGLSSLSFRQEAYTWLDTTMKERMSPAFEEALGILALSGGGKDVSALVQRLIENKDSNEVCWPKGQCRVRDTAVVLLALDKAGQTTLVDEGKLWLEEALVAGLKRGEWQIQIKSSGSGSCQLSVDGSSPRTFQIEDDKIKGTRGEYYIRHNELDPSLLNKVSPVVNVDCGGLASTANPVIALLYRESSTNLFLLESHSSFRADLKISNACFAQEARDLRCSDEDTLFASWALAEMDGSEGVNTYGTLTYLQTKIKANTPVGDLALMNKLLSQISHSHPYYLQLLSQKQGSDGGWGDPYSTALAVFALKPSALEYQEEIGRGESYLERSFDSTSRSWSKDVRTTSMALLALEGSLSSSFVDLSKLTRSGGGARELICDDGVDDDGDTFPDCGDSDCSSEENCLCFNGVQDFDEEGLDCGGSCPSVCEVTSGGSEISDIECSDNLDCNTGKSCVAGSCVSSSSPSKEEKSLWWLWLLVIVLVLGGAFAFYWFFVRTGKINIKLPWRKKKTNFEDFKRDYQRPQVQQRPQERSVQRPTMKPVVRSSDTVQKSKEDLELERSLREAEKILHGK